MDIISHSKTKIVEVNTNTKQLNIYNIKIDKYRQYCNKLGLVNNSCCLTTVFGIQLQFLFCNNQINDDSGTCKIETGRWITLLYNTPSYIFLRFFKLFIWMLFCEHTFCHLSFKYIEINVTCQPVSFSCRIFMPKRTYFSILFSFKLNIWYVIPEFFVCFFNTYFAYICHLFRVYFHV